MAFPPHRRGWTRGLLWVPVVLPVSPAQAGMDPFGGSTEPIVLRVSPAQAGMDRFSGPGRCREDRVSPAQAGMDLTRPEVASQRRGFPRTGGDGPMVDRKVTLRRLFPPHRRGWAPRRSDLVGLPRWTLYVR